MAKIETNRAEAAQYNGRDAKFVCDVVSGPAYNPDVDQTIVLIDGKELYFFANEVKLDEAEAKLADERKAAAADAAAKAAEQAANNKANRAAEFAKSARK